MKRVVIASLGANAGAWYALAITHVFYGRCGLFVRSLPYRVDCCSENFRRVVIASLGANAEAGHASSAIHVLDLFCGTLLQCTIFFSMIGCDVGCSWVLQCYSLGLTFSVGRAWVILGSRVRRGRTTHQGRMSTTCSRLRSLLKCPRCTFAPTCPGGALYLLRMNFLCDVTPYFMHLSQFLKQCTFAV
jgi:hypothetical protein